MELEVCCRADAEAPARWLDGAARDGHVPWPVPPAPRIAGTPGARRARGRRPSPSGAGGGPGARPPAGTTTVPPTTTCRWPRRRPTTTPPTTVPADTSGRQWLVPVPIGLRGAGAARRRVRRDAARRPARRPARRRPPSSRRPGSGSTRPGPAPSSGTPTTGSSTCATASTRSTSRRASSTSSAPASTRPPACSASKVREPEPLFGGDEVIGAAESDVSCPAIVDPVRTLDVDGTPIEAGVISPLADAKRASCGRCCCR